MSMQVEHKDLAMALNDLNCQVQRVAALVGAMGDTGYLDDLNDHARLEKVGWLVSVCRREADQAVVLGEQCERLKDAKASRSTSGNQEALSEAS